MTFAKLTRFDIDKAATGELIAGVAGKQIRVYGLILSSAGNTSELNDGAGNTMGALRCANAPFVLSRVDDPYMTCDAGLGLDLTLGATDQNDGVLWYSQS